MIAVGVQDDDTEPVEGNRLEDIRDAVGAIDVKLQFLSWPNLCSRNSLKIPNVT